VGTEVYRGGSGLSPVLALRRRGDRGPAGLGRRLRRERHRLQARAADHSELEAQLEPHRVRVSGDSGGGAGCRGPTADLLADPARPAPAASARAGCQRVARRGHRDRGAARAGPERCWTAACRRSAGTRHWGGERVIARNGQDPGLQAHQGSDLDVGLVYRETNDHQVNLAPRSGPEPVPKAARVSTSWRPGAPGKPARSAGRPRRRPGSARGSVHAARTRRRRTCR
jgi:hypothetical protein